MDDRCFAELAKALGHPARMQIVRLLQQRESCVCGPIVDELGMAQSTVSQHLKILKEAGVVQGTISGRTTCYCLDHSALSAAAAVLASLTQTANPSPCSNDTCC